MYRDKLVGYLVLQPVEEHRVPSQVCDGQLLRIDRLVAGDGALALGARREQIVVADDVAATAVGLQGIEEHCSREKNGRIFRDHNIKRLMKTKP